MLNVLQVGERGKVVGIDHIQELVDWSTDNTKKGGHSDLLDSGRVKYVGESVLKIFFFKEAKIKIQTDRF